MTDSEIYRNLGFIATIGEDEDVPTVSESSSSDDEAVLPVKKAKKKGTKSGEFNPDFKFLGQNDPLQLFNMDMALSMAKKRKQHTTLDEKIQKFRIKNKKQKVSENGGEELSDNDDSMEEDDESSDEETVADKVKVKEGKRKKKKKGEVEEEEEKVQFSECVDSYKEGMIFSDMNVSRPLLKGLNTLRFTEPTPIQSATIPIAMQGRDICACAVTGSGKTVAFMLPILERLLYKPKNQSMTRVLILVPTRELAVQVHQVAKQLAQFTNIEIVLSTGGLDLKAQEAALRHLPDIVVATPGRLIDHLHNSPSFNINNIEILVLDEADRMLDEYFAEQMKEVIRLCNIRRQTMLFSATMSDAVKDLAAVSLNNPVKIFVNENTDLALGLRQEFIRIRQNREGDREAIIGALLSRTFRDHCIVFIQTKKQAHRMHLVLGLLGVNVGELHGNLSQAQRLETLKKFKSSEIDILLATDLAARGLDIANVKTVINFTMPNTLKHYIHRVGRTARAGKIGRAVSLVGEQERKLLKDVVKKATTPLKSRIIPQEVINRYKDKINKMDEDIKQIEIQEQEEREMRAAENQTNKMERLLGEKKECGDMKRTWFQSHKERIQEKDALRLGEFSKLPSRKKGKKGKDDKKKALTDEDRVKFEIQKSQQFSAKHSKRAMKPKRMRAFDDSVPDSTGPKKANMSKKKKGSSFSKELTNTSRSALKKFRGGPSYLERKEMGLVGKKGKTKNTKSQNRGRKR